MSGDLHIPIHPAHRAEVQRDEEKLKAIIACATSFRSFLDYWYFRSTKKRAEVGEDGDPMEDGKVRNLGQVLWSGQQSFVTAVDETEWLYALKARKLGFTTIECAYDGWVARFRDQNARVHLFSRRQDAAQELLTAVKFGLRKLPPWMQLPVLVSNKSELVLAATYTCPECAGQGCDKCDGQGVIEDERTVKAYPADEETAVEASCSHGHVDEWARMQNPRQVWQAIEPTMAGSCHIITTGRGPTNYSSTFWRAAMAGDNGFKPFFVHALNRPDRSEAWLKAKRQGMTEMAGRQEYAMTWEDALFGGGDFIFDGSDVDVALTDFRGPQLAEKGRKYIKAWDVGRHKDAAVGIVLDVTEQVEDVVGYYRYRGIRYPELQQRIERVHEAYPGYTVIEKNAAGEAVAENLTISEEDLILFSTTGQSKPRIIEGLELIFQAQCLRFDPQWESLESEVRGYQVPDDDIVQDSVIALAIAHEHAPLAYTRGRVGKVGTW